MGLKKRRCTKCGADLPDLCAEKCLRCGERIKRPWYTGIGFWSVICIGILVLCGLISIHDSALTDEAQKPNEDGSQSGTVHYEPVDLQTLLDELDRNAASSGEDYQDQYVQFEGRIAMLDGDGAYIRVKPADSDEWNAATVLCYVSDSEQREFLRFASRGDPVTVRGRITRVSALRGYTLRIHEIES